GNVALDVARILLRPPKELATTDIASHALDALKGKLHKEILSCR
nr:NADPH:adrenodoxin oxidoreductase, mitochondrial [Tanacetum cinerariifolium]